MYPQRDGSTYGDKRREQTAGARRDLCPVPLGPPLGLLAAQHGPRHVRQILRPVRDLLDVGHRIFMLRHTGFASCGRLRRLPTAIAIRAVAGRAPSRPRTSRLGGCGGRARRGEGGMCWR
jgi:hypothetical protein